MRVSHETIYTSLYVQGRGALRKDLAGHLRTGRAMRKPRAQGQARQGCRGQSPAQRDLDQRTTTRGRGPRRARSLGRRPDHGRQQHLGDRHPGRTRHPLPDLAPPARRPHRPHRPERDVRTDGQTARAAAPDPDLGSRQRDDQPRPDRRGHRPGHLLRRPRLTLATRHQREHQRPAAPVLPQRHRPLLLGTRVPRPGRPRDEQPTPQDPGLGHTSRSPRPTTLTTQTNHPALHSPVESTRSDRLETTKERRWAPPPLVEPVETAAACAGSRPCGHLDKLDERCSSPSPGLRGSGAERATVSSLGTAPTAGRACRDRRSVRWEPTLRTSRRAPRPRWDGTTAGRACRDRRSVGWEPTPRTSHGVLPRPRWDGTSRWSSLSRPPQRSAGSRPCGDLDKLDERCSIGCDHRPHGRDRGDAGAGGHADRAGRGRLAAAGAGARGGGRGRGRGHPPAPAADRRARA